VGSQARVVFQVRAAAFPAEVFLKVADSPAAVAFRGAAEFRAVGFPVLVGRAGDSPAIKARGRAIRLRPVR